MIDQILSGDTPPMGALMAPEYAAWMAVGCPRLPDATKSTINRAREAVARLAMKTNPSAKWVNTPHGMTLALTGEAGPELMAIAVALVRCERLVAESDQDSSISEWQRNGCPLDR